MVAQELKCTQDTEQYTSKWLKWQMLYDINFIKIKKF